MNYDLSKVPRPLHLRTLKVFTRPGIEGWEVVVSDGSFNVVVACVDGWLAHAKMVRTEVEDVLKAARLLAGKQTFLDTLQSR